MGWGCTESPEQISGGPNEDLYVTASTLPICSDKSPAPPRVSVDSSLPPLGNCEAFCCDLLTRMCMCSSSSRCLYTFISPAQQIAYQQLSADCLQLENTLWLQRTGKHLHHFTACLGLLAQYVMNGFTGTLVGRLTYLPFRVDPFQMNVTEKHLERS